MSKRKLSGVYLLGAAGLFCAAMTLITFLPGDGQQAQAEDQQNIVTGSARPMQTGPSGLPLPRFVSLKSDRVNVRAGPGQAYPVSWIFTQAGTPVEIVAEFDNWRRIRDAEGAEGWVYHSLLSGRRTGLVTPWEQPDNAKPLYRNAAAGSRIVAQLESTVMVNISGCDGSWCDVSIKGHQGFVMQDALWGVYPHERIDN